VAEYELECSIQGSIKLHKGSTHTNVKQCLFYIGCRRGIAESCRLWETEWETARIIGQRREEYNVRVAAVLW